jgi:peptidoglycan/xylan/chitin deacetylase (PgdA/CDA1 family)
MRTHLCFHGIGTCVVEREPGEARYWMGEDLFLRLLDRVQGRPDVELSFDDGNKTDVEIALHALRERGLQATFFPIVGRLDDPASLDPSDLRELRDNGMQIGSHGWRHVPWRKLPDAEARREFVDARLALEEASGVRITAAACPLGRYDRRSLQRLKRAGYRVVYTSDRFPARPSSWLQARYSVTAVDTMDSLTRVLTGRPSLQDVRNLLVSTVKRMR